MPPTQTTQRVPNRSSKPIDLGGEDGAAPTDGAVGGGDCGSGGGEAGGSGDALAGISAAVCVVEVSAAVAVGAGASGGAAVGAAPRSAPPTQKIFETTGRWPPPGRLRSILYLGSRLPTFHDEP
jgi:hypothetical protein